MCLDSDKNVVKKVFGDQAKHLFTLSYRDGFPLFTQNLFDFLLHLLDSMFSGSRTFLRLTVADQAFAVGWTGEFLSIYSNDIHIK